MPVAATPEFIERLRAQGLLDPPPGATCPMVTTGTKKCGKPATVGTLTGATSLTPTAYCAQHAASVAAAQRVAADAREAALDEERERLAAERAEAERVERDAAMAEEMRRREAEAAARHAEAQQTADEPTIEENP